MTSSRTQPVTGTGTGLLAIRRAQQLGSAPQLRFRAAQLVLDRTSISLLAVSEAEADFRQLLCKFVILESLRCVKLTPTRSLLGLPRRNQSVETSQVLPL